MQTPQIGLVMGSQSDWPTLRAETIRAAKALEAVLA